MRVVNAYKDNSGKIVAMWRDEKGALQEQVFRSEQSIFFKAHEVPDDLIREWRKEPTCLSMSQHGEWLKTVWQDVTNFIEGKPVTLRRWLCYNNDSPIVERQIQTYEGDVHPVKRWMIDNDIEIQRPRIAYFDLECDSRVSFKEKREMRILSYAIVGEDGVEKTNVLNEETNEDERRLLCDFWNDVEEYDLLVAWNADGFDNEVLLARTKKRSVPIEPKRKLVLDHMRLYERMNKQVAESGDEKSSMALEAVAQAQLGEGKHDFDASKTYQSWKAGGAERERLVRYNLQDTRLLKRIEERTGYISTFLALCECMFVFPDSRGALPTEQVDSYILRLGKRDGIHFKTKKQVDRNEEHEQFLGAFVMQPTFEGIAKNVHVSDFRRLYPSVIRTWNISPETKLGKFATKEEAPAGSAWCPYTQIAFSTETKGMFPRVVDEFIAKREEWANLKASLPPGTPEWHDADRRSNSYKVAANATFGVAGTPSFRFYDREVGESITQNAKYLIEETIKFQERESAIKVKYGDTDSTFGVGVTREEFTALVKRCNVELYPKLVVDLGCKPEWNDIWLAYEKEFSRVVFVSAKRYCNPPEAPILMGDFSFKSLGDIHIGDVVMGWRQSGGNKRELIESEVVALHRHRAPIVKVTMESGRVLRCTPDHQWLRARKIELTRNGRRYEYAWCTPRVGRKLTPVLDTPRVLNEEERVAASWLGGIFDGEGSLASNHRGQIVISQSRSVNPEVCDRIEESLSQLGFDYGMWKESCPSTKSFPSKNDCNKYAIRGGKQARFNFMTWCKPAKWKRIAASLKKSFFSNLKGQSGDSIVSIEPDGFGVVIGMTTTTGNYVAWGYASKNCGKFAHYKGKAPKQDSRPEIKGLEYKRGDTAKLARELQENVIRLLLGDWVAPFNSYSDDPADYRKLIEAARDHVLNDELDPEHVVLSKSVTKDLDDYETKIKADGTETDLTHIAIAKMLEKRGMDVSPGTRVFYVITDASISPMVAIPVQDYTGKEADRFYLWENLVWPPTQRLLESAFPRENWRTYDRARPKVKRTRLTGGADHLARQGVLFSEAAVVVPQAQRAEVPIARAQPQSMRRPKFGPIKLTVDYAVKDRLQDLVAILQRHPGTRAVEIEVRVGTSSNFSLVELLTPIQCSGSPEMIAEYNAWKAASSQV